MEKKTPHTRLHRVKTLVEQGKVRVTNTAINGADELGIDFDGICRIVKALKTNDFYKSMTTYQDHTIWQDVYRTEFSNRIIYLKITVNNDVLIISFKEK